MSGTGTGIRETWTGVDGLEREHAWLLLGDAPTPVIPEEIGMELSLRLQRAMEIDLFR